MLKKRLIFTLHYADGMFVLSRNFRLQKVGDINWLKENYNFSETAKYLDELIILNVRPSNDNKEEFANILKEVSKYCFIPISAGGGINSLDDAKLLLKNGADKIIVNSAIFNNKNLVIKLGKNLGSQCVIASVDFIIKDNKVFIYIENGSKLISNDINHYLEYIQKLPIGEFFINSISRDGTGTGLEIKFFDFLKINLNHPLIFSGGVGNWKHFYDGLINKNIDAVSTANLFNFISNGIKNARMEILKSKINLPRF